MEIDPNLLVAAKIVHDECVKNSSCTNCQLRDICGWGGDPNDWEIPDPPPEPTERPRIEWLKALPDDEMSEAVFRIVECCKCCVGCDGHNDCSCQQLTLEWMHQAVTLKQFRKDVGLK